MQRKNIFLWTLYDFANSIVTVVFFLYFSQWLVIEHGVSDFAYNMIFTVGSVLLLVTAPVLGAIADQTGKERRYLAIVTLLCALFYFFTTFTALFLPQRVMLAALFFLLANYFYQFSFVFYNAMLRFIAPPAEWGRVSGVGQAGNWFGQMFGLLVTLPFAGGAVYLFGAAGRAQTFLPAVVLFVLLSLPLLLFLRLPRQSDDRPHVTFTAEYRDQWRRFYTLVKAPGMGAFLLSYFLFNDAIITVMNNFPIYLQNVFGVSDNVKSLLLLSILFTSAIGALISGWATDRLGIKRMLMILLVAWLIAFPAMGLLTNFPAFVALSVVIGLLFGSIWTVTRAAMTALCPQAQVNFGFSFYTLAERVSTLVGPLAWGLIVSSMTDVGALRYRIALIAMTLFVALGIFILRKTDIRSS